MNDSTKTDITPVFVFSLPRAGSTLLQKVLSTHATVASTAEPWVLLPLIYSLKSEGIYTEYAQCIGSIAINEFMQELPESRADYQAALREFTLRLYRGAAGVDATHFVDKTPRYHLIASDILDIFPDAKCILLWRNPLAIAASMLNTWGAGRWNLYRYNVDLYKGLLNLISLAQHRPDRLLQIKYEDMTSAPEGAWPKIFAHLGLTFDTSFLETYQSVSFSGRMGDPTGGTKFDRISAASIDSWPATFNNPLRRRWAYRYLDWIGEDRLEAMGYRRAELLSALEARAPSGYSGLASDAAFMALGHVHAPLDLSGIKRQIRIRRSSGRCYAAT